MPVPIWYHPITYALTDYHREGIKTYTPDFLIRHKGNGQAYLIELKPTGYNLGLGMSNVMRYTLSGIGHGHPFPKLWQEFIKRFFGMIGDSGKNIFQPFSRIDPMEPAGGKKAVDNRCIPGSVFRSGKHKILSPKAIFRIWPSVMLLSMERRPSVQ